MEGELPLPLWWNVLLPPASSLTTSGDCGGCMQLTLGFGGQTVTWQPRAVWDGDLGDLLVCKYDFMTITFCSKQWTAQSPLSSPELPCRAAHQDLPSSGDTSLGSSSRLRDSLLHLDSSQGRSSESEGVLLDLSGRVSLTTSSDPILNAVNNEVYLDAKSC